MKRPSFSDEISQDDDVLIAPEDLSAGRHFSPRQLKLLDQLEDIILAEGFGELTVGALAARLRCSRRALYELAPSKDELVLLVLDRLMRQVARSAREVVRTQQDPVGRVRAFLMGGLVEARRATLAFSTDLASTPAVQRLFNAHFRYATFVLEGLVREGVEAGALRPVQAHVVAETVDAALSRLENPRVLRVAGLTFAEAVEEMMSLILEGIVVNEPSQRRRKTRRS